jgi:hypothetical protein
MFLSWCCFNKPFSPGQGSHWAKYDDRDTLMSFPVESHPCPGLLCEDYRTVRAHLSYMLDTKPHPVYKKKSRYTRLVVTREYYVTLRNPLFWVTKIIVGTYGQQRKPLSEFARKWPSIYCVKQNQWASLYFHEQTILRNKKTPNNTAILQTQGYVLFKQNKTQGHCQTKANKIESKYHHHNLCLFFFK